MPTEAQPQNDYSDMIGRAIIQKGIGESQNLMKNLEGGLFTGQYEKSFIDKLLAKEEVNQIRNLIKTNKLTREQMLELLYLISGNEAKLLNYGDWDRYIILKFFVWVRDFVKNAELLYDFQDKVDKNPALLTPRGHQLLENARNNMEHNIKFLAELYLNIARTTLSKGATGFLEPLKNKFDISYAQPSLSQPQENKFLGIFPMKK